MMHKYEELEYSQIASALACSESAVKSLLFRAYETLQRATRASWLRVLVQWRKAFAQASLRVKKMTNCPLQVQRRGGDPVGLLLPTHGPGSGGRLPVYMSRSVWIATQVVEAQEAVWAALDSYEAMPVSRDFDRKFVGEN